MQNNVNKKTFVQINMNIVSIFAEPGISDPKHSHLILQNPRSQNQAWRKRNMIRTVSSDILMEAIPGSTAARRKHGKRILLEERSQSEHRLT